MTTNNDLAWNRLAIEKEKAIMTLLDKQIEKDLSELYCGNGLSDAITLNSKGVVNGVTFSTHGLPQHFVGKRDADTVFVMLNPSDDACIANTMFNAKTASYNRNSRSGFIESYYQDRSKFNINRTMPVDPFDVKQAAFLKPWVDSGISFPNSFPFCKCSHWDAVDNVLNQKLQLELIPYCSNSFGSLNSVSLGLLMPFLEIVFDEIIAKKRKYVIFGSKVFEQLFRFYNRYPKKKGPYDNRVWLGSKKTDGIKMLDKALKIKTISVTNIPVEVFFSNYRFSAIIAGSFPSYALSSNYSLMLQYGDICYKNY